MKVRVNPSSGVHAVRVNSKTTVTKEWTEVTKSQGEALLKRTRRGQPLVLEKLPKKTTTD
jgi:hypothetical protein